MFKVVPKKHTLTLSAFHDTGEVIGVCVLEKLSSMS